MAPAEGLVLQWQTEQIIRCLFEDEDELQCRTFAGRYETDSEAGAEDDNFDAALIADRLRTVADALNEDARVRAILVDLKQAAAQEALEVAFSQGVETICQAHVSQKAEVCPEMQLIKASVAFGLYIKKSSPELKYKIQRAMSSFLTRRVGSWVTQNGGWDKVI